MNGSVMCIDDLILKLKEKGVKFNIVDENDAKKFLYINTYYTKIAAYRFNYRKDEETGERKNLEFAYLKELSTIDMYLRNILMKMCVNVEHYLKVKLLKEWENVGAEKGEAVIEYFYSTYPDIKMNLLRNLNNNYCKSLMLKYDGDFFKNNPRTVDKYKLKNPKLPIWVLCESLSFGELINMIKVFNKINSLNKIINPKTLYPVKNLRNAVAHNHTIISNLNETDNFTRTGTIAHNDFSDIGKDSFKNMMKNQSVHDFTFLIFVHNQVVLSEDVKIHINNELLDFFDGRMIKNKDYFEDNQILKSRYKYCKKIIKNNKK